MLLKRLYVSNFKSFDHSGQFIDLNEGVTILLGRNDSGKTNFIEAMEIIIGHKSPYNTYLDNSKFHDPSKSINIEAELSNINEDDLCKVAISDTQRGMIRNKPERELSLRFNYSSYEDDSSNEKEGEEEEKNTQTSSL